MASETGSHAAISDAKTAELVLVWSALPLVFAPGDARVRPHPQRRFGWPVRSAIGLGVWLADHHPLPRIFAACILLFVVSFPLVIVFRRIRPLFVAAAWCFHLGTLLLLGLDDVVWPCTVTILLLNWPTVADCLGISNRDALLNRAYAVEQRTSPETVPT